MKCERCGHINVKKLSDLYLDGFDQFWIVYPRKAGKMLAKKMWSRLKPDQGLQILIYNAVLAHKNSPSWLQNGGVYVPHPSSWLNGRRWEDVLQNGSPEIDPERVERKKEELESLKEREWLRLNAHNKSK